MPFWETLAYRASYNQRCYQDVLQCSSLKSVKSVRPSFHSGGRSKCKFHSKEMYLAGTLDAMLEKNRRLAQRITRPFLQPNLKPKPTGSCSHLANLSHPRLHQ